jgi:hypothetical protein
MHWQSFTHRLPDGSTCQGHRSAVPGGWIVMLPNALGGGAFFYDDPSHRWTGDHEPHAPSSRAHGRSSSRAPKKSSPTSHASAPWLAWQPFLHVLSGSSPREGFRAPVPGGWFVMIPVRPGGGVFFFRDAQHAWGAESARALAGTATAVGSGPFARARTLVEWEPVRHSLSGRALQEAYRARVPGGWFLLVALEPGGGVFFFEDARGAW